jgi:hypothetical protein
MRRADAANMLSHPPPKSNLERQRLFRLRHPGYFNKYNARRSAMGKEVKEKMRAMAAAMSAMDNHQQLMVPAPVQTIEIPGMNTISPISMNSQFSVA